MQDKIQSFWDITRRELESCRSELRNKDRDIEDLQDRHQVEMKVPLGYLIAEAMRFLWQSVEPINLLSRSCPAPPE